MRHRLLPLFILTAACATQPPAPTAAEGTVARAQQTYSQALQKCQQEYRRDMGVDAGMGAAPTADDAAFSACLTQPKADLDQQMRKAESEDGGPRAALN
jgi:hypothetical protein